MKDLFLLLQIDPVKAAIFKCFTMHRLRVPRGKEIGQKKEFKKSIASRQILFPPKIVNTSSGFRPRIRLFIANTEGVYTISSDSDYYMTENVIMYVVQIIAELSH